MKKITIKELANQLEVSQESIRNWEKYFSVSVPRGSKNIRFYTEDLVITFSKIKQLKKNGLSDKEIKEELGVEIPKSTSDNLKQVQTSNENHNLLDLNLVVNEINKNLKEEIKANNELALNLANVSREMGFLQGTLKYIESENKNLLQTTSNNKEIIEELNNKLLLKDKENIELQFKLNMNLLQVQNLEYQIVTKDEKIEELSNKLKELQTTFEGFNDLTFFQKIKFRYEK